jgi:nucleotide-binding universal stress UspA family protein
MIVRTLLVGTDLSDRADPAIVRGHQLAKASGARLVVCHVSPGRMATHALFPQQHQDDIVAATQFDANMAEAVSSRVAELTGRSPDTFEVVIDQGSPARALCEQSARFTADLIVVMADRETDDGDAIVTRDLVRGCGCSVLVLCAGAGTEPRRGGAAVVALEGEVELIPALVDAALFVASPPPSAIDVVLWVNEQDLETSSITAQLDRHARSLGVRLVPWFAKVRDTSVLMAQAAQHPDIGLLVFVAPAPPELVKGISSPIDDVLPQATSSILLLRVGWPAA